MVGSATTGTGTQGKQRHRHGHGVQAAVWFAQEATRTTLVRTRARGPYLDAAALVVCGTKGIVLAKSFNVMSPQYCWFKLHAKSKTWILAWREHVTGTVTRPSTATARAGTGTNTQEFVRHDHRRDGCLSNDGR